MILLATPIYASSSSSQLDKSLQDINSSFINAHSAAREFDLAEGPVILYRNGQLILIKNDTKITANVIFQTYHTFKVFAHIPVAIYLMLSPQGEGPIESKNLQLLRSYYKKLEYVHKNMHQITLNSTELKKQKIILSRSIEFLKAILDNKKFNLTTQS